MDINGSPKNHHNCLSFTVTFFFFFPEAWKLEVTAPLTVASASEDRAELIEAPLFISGVSRPLSRFFLLINLLTPLYCVNWGWEALQAGIAANNRWVQLSSWRMNSDLSNFMIVPFKHALTSAFLAAQFFSQFLWVIFYALMFLLHKHVYDYH